MTRSWPFLAAITACAAAGFAPAAAEVRVVVDGRLQEVPDGVIRVISYSPGGRQTIRDEPFRGPVAIGAATITTEETIEEDERGRTLSTHVVTRIVPIRAAATVQVAAQPAYASPAAPRSGVAHLAWAPETIAAQPPERLGQGALRIRRDPVTGHFIMPIRINGVEIRAIVDTGAANTILSPRDAHATGADGQIVDSQAMIGIGGYTMLNIARVQSLEVGGQDLGGMTTPVGQEGLGYTLLGQSEIARLGRIVIEDGTMTIIPRGTQIASADLG
jgi:clan AA aspartic protease (TIGR02281 family)